jgi:carbamoyltransferase
MKDRRDHLGIYTGHNATVALVRDGRVEACVSEERFTGVKNQTGYPAQSLAYLQGLGFSPDSAASANLGFERLAPQVAVGESSGLAGLGAATLLYKAYGLGQHAGQRVPAIRSLTDAAYRFYYRAFASGHAQREAQRLALRLGLDPQLMHRREHHLCHAYAAYYGSPYSGEDATVLTLDGEGDTLCATVQVVRQGRWQRLSASPSSASIGLLYMWVTVLLGMKANEHEYKVMGLAAYAKRQYIVKLLERIKGLVGFEADGLTWRSGFDLHSALGWLKRELEGERFDVIAGAFQQLLEERLAEWVTSAVRATGVPTVVCGGGVFMNVKANLRVAQLDAVERLFIFPSCGDDSVAIGAAYAGYLASGPAAPIEPIGPIYWGPSFSNDQVEAHLRSSGAFDRYRVSWPADIEDSVAELLAQKQVVARLRGRMEFGARALGNRSILAHPGDPDTVRVINEQMKNRDFWMPFAGTVLEERSGDYLVNPKGLFSPYMMQGFETQPRAAQEIRAAIHPYDFSMRPQILREGMNPSYHRLLKRFEARTGLGALLNTSFNLHGYPVVLGPAEALHAFENSGLRWLAMEDFLIEKA